MTIRFPFRTAVAGLTAAALVIAPVAAPGSPNYVAAAAQSAQSVLPVPGYVGVEAHPAGTESEFTATVLPNVSGEVVFVITSSPADGKAGTEVARKQAPIEGGKATLKYALPAAGDYLVQATVLRNGELGEPSAAYAFTVADPQRAGGSSVKADITAADIAGPIVGAVVSLAVLIGSQTSIPGIERAITDGQKALGIYNPQMVQVASQTLPVAGGVIGLAGLIAAIVQLVKALKETEVEVTVTKDA